MACFEGGFQGGKAIFQFALFQRLYDHISQIADRVGYARIDLPGPDLVDRFRNQPNNRSMKLRIKKVVAFRGFVASKRSSIMPPEKKKSILLRINTQLWNDLNQWSQDELRSVNAQIEYVLREEVRQRKKRKQSD